jgi:IS30 family transposase
MQDNKRQNLSVNERKIVELTLQGESQKGIANKLNIAPSTVYRTLRREHIQDMITSATQGLMSSLVQKMLQNYEKAQERVSREIDTMPIQSVIYYMNHVKQAVQHIHIDVAKGEFQKLQEAKKGKTVFHIKYSDTDAMFDRQVKNALRKFNIPEEVIQQQNFEYG